MRKFFSKAIYTTTLRRYWAGSALMAVVFILIALTYHSLLRMYNPPYHWEGPLDELFVFTAGTGLISIIWPAAFFAAAAAVLCAVLIFSYLHHKRGAVMMHAIPVRREAHFISAFSGGLTLIWTPIVFGIGLCAVIQASFGGFNAASIGITLALLLLASLAAYSLAVLAGLLTGSTLGQFSILAILLALPALLELFIHQLCQNFLFGFGGGTMWVNQHLHPVSLFRKLSSRAWTWMQSPHDPEHTGGIPAGDWGIFLFLSGYCALFIVVSLLLYRKRRLERAGDFIAVRGMRPVFRYGTAFLGAYLFGLIGSAVDGYSSFNAYSSHMYMGGWGGSPLVGGGSYGWMFYGIAGGIVGFFVAEMFIRKTVKVHRHWKGALLFTGCYAAVVFSLMFDIYGYGNYVLPEGGVESVYLSETRLPREQSPEWLVEPLTFMFKGEDMGAALALQDFIAKEGRKTTREWRNWRPSRRDFAERDLRELYPFTTRMFYLNAELTNGRTVSRVYWIHIPNDSAAWDAKIKALYETAWPQSLERLRNVGLAARRLELVSYIHSFHDYERDIFVAMDLRAGGHNMDPLVLYGQEKMEFIEMLRLDNQEIVSWEWSGRLRTDWEFYARNLKDSAFIEVSAILDDSPYFEIIYIHVMLGDHNAIGWLIERDYLPQAMTDFYYNVLEELANAA